MKTLISCFVLLLSVTPVVAIESAARHGRSASQYQSDVEDFARSGFQVVHVSAFPTKAGERFAALWLKKSQPESIARHGITSRQLQAESTRYAANGFHITRLSGYEVRGSERFAAIWEKERGPTRVAKHSLTEREYQAEFTRMAQQGFRLIYVDGFSSRGSDRYSAIWEKSDGPEWKARHRMNSAAYQKAFTDEAASGFRLAHVSAYTVGTEDLYAAIWEKSDGRAWRSHHQMTHESYQKNFNTFSSQGFHVAHIDGYQINGESRYAAIWEKGSAAAPPETYWTAAVAVVSSGKTAPQLKPLDDLMSSFLLEHNLPGGSLAVSKNSQLVYSRGFGYADVGKKETVQPQSLFRIASISKPITAAAIMQLQERGKLDLDDPVRRYVQLTPTSGNRPVDSRWDKVTLRQLLHHTGGWDRDVSFDPMFQSVEFAKLLKVSPPAGPEHIIRAMLGRRLDFDPGARYAYSNFGYCLLGRVIEKVAGHSYEQYVKTEVLKPLGITSMRIGITLESGRAPSEVRYYDPAMSPSVFASNFGKAVSNPYGAWHLEAMDAHGAWIASAEDLVRFGSAFDNPAKCPILKPASIAEMFARPPGNAGFENGRPKASYYGCGWSVRLVRDKANHWHTGSLSGTSTIMVHRHDGFTWAVLFNSRRGKDGKNPAGEIDSLVHRAVDAVGTWP